MKGLIITSTIMLAIIAAGVGTSAIIYINLDNSLAAAHERGWEEGRAQGDEDGVRKGSEVGYQEGSKVGYGKGNGASSNSSDEPGIYFTYNPTYEEMRQILAESEAGSALKIHNYAEANGIRVAYVRCQIARQAAEGMVYIYELVAFETVDKGFIIIEPWSLKEVTVEVGQRYSELNGFPIPDYDDTIIKKTIVW